MGQTTRAEVMTADRPYHRAVRALLLLLLLPALSACDRYDGDGVLVTPPCDEQRVEKLQPPNQSSDAWIGGLVWVDLSCTAPTGSLSLAGPSGSVAGSIYLAHGGRQIRFEPAAPMVPDANYVARLDTTDGYREWEFRTSALGPPVAASLTERALALHPAQAAVLDPPGFIDILPAALQSGLHPVIQLLDEPANGQVPLRLGGRLDARATAGQDLDERTWEFQATWEDPVWSIGPFDLRWPLFDFELVLEDATWEGALATDIGSGGGGQLEGLWDIRPAEGTLGSGPGSLCDQALTASGEGCTACRDGAMACLPFSVHSVPGEAWGGVLQTVDPT